MEKKVTLEFKIFWILTHLRRNSIIERTLMYVHVFTFFCDSSFFTFSLSQSPKLWSSFLIWMPHKFASKLKSLTVSQKGFQIKFSNTNILIVRLIYLKSWIEIIHFFEWYALTTYNTLYKFSYNELQIQIHTTDYESSKYWDITFASIENLASKSYILHFTI